MRKNLAKALAGKAGCFFCFFVFYKKINLEEEILPNLKITTCILQINLELAQPPKYTAVLLNSKASQH